MILEKMVELWLLEYYLEETITQNDKYDNSKIINRIANLRSEFLKPYVNAEKSE